MTRRLMTVAVVTMAMAMVMEVMAQERRQGGPPPYDLAAETTVTGIATEVETFTPPSGAPQSILMMTVDKTPTGVFLGPAEWFGRQNFRIEAGARVEVVGLTGARFNGNPAVMPRTIKVGTRVLEVRNAKGIPAWDQRIGAVGPGVR